jgi:VWFA-related protein
VTSFRARLVLSLFGFAGTLAVITVSAGRAQGPQPGHPSAAQQPPPPPVQGPLPTFKSEVNYVEVDAIVTDSSGTFVRDLSKDDFQVFEDRKLQTITTCERVDIPVERAVRPLFATQPIEPDVRSNEHPFDGRIYVMVIDDLHTAFGRTERVRRTARQFIEQRLGANDLMAVVTTGGTAARREFTTNRQLLLSAVDSVNGRRLASATRNKLDAYRIQGDLRLPGEPIADPEEPRRADDARSTLRTLRSVADWLSRIHGRRKSILFVSEGLEYDIFNQASSILSAASSNPRAIYDEMRETISAAARADVSIYGIDPRGLATAGDEDIEIDSYPTDPSLGLRPTSLLDELRISQDSLRMLSDETGGFAVVNRNDVGSAYERIVEDNSSYYVLAYYPPSDARDGRAHTIDVRVGRPGLTVRARKSYVTPKEGETEPAVKPTGGVSKELRELLESPLPVSGLGLRVFGAPFKGNPPNASVLLSTEMKGSDLHLGPMDVVELVYVALDSEGKVRGSSTDTITMNLRPEVKEQIASSGLRFTKRLTLAPGRYQVRVAGRDSAGGAIGLVLYDLDVPDFNRARFSMSGLVLTSREAQALPTTKPDDALKDVLPGPPVAIREFSPSDEISLFAELYDNQASTPHGVDITTTVRTTEGAIVFKESEERDASELQGSHGGYGHTSRIPLRGFAPGLYVLNVEGRSRLGREFVASREIQFSVVRSEALPSR